MTTWMHLLPRALRRRLLLRHVRIDRSKLEPLRLSRGTGERELRGALGLVHDAYVAAGIIEARPSGLHVTQHNILPTSLIFVARSQDDRVVATTMLVPDDPNIGVP